MLLSDARRDSLPRDEDRRTAAKDTGIIATKNAKIAKMGRLKCFFQTPVETLLPRDEDRRNCRKRLIATKTAKKTSETYSFSSQK
jgi:hypothetical protein